MQWEVARSRSRGKPAQVTEAGGGDTVREGGPSCGGEEGVPRPVRKGDREVAREIERAPPAGRGERIPAPRSGRKSSSKGSFFGRQKEEPGGPAPGPGIGNGNVLSGPRPGLPSGPARPLAAGSRSRCRPSPSEAPTLPPSRPRSRSPRAPPREPAPSSSCLPSRAAPPLLPRPLQRPQLTHAASGPALSLTHTARPRLLSGPHIMRHSYATCCARANLARSSRRRGEDVGAIGGISKRSWEMKFRVWGGGGNTSKHLPSALACGIRSFL